MVQTFTQIPLSPSISPPTGFQVTDNFFTPLFPAKLNILYIIADQLATPLLKAYNSKSQIKTSNINKLVAKLVVFNSAYYNLLLYAPSRIAIIID